MKYIDLYEAVVQEFNVFSKEYKGRDRNAVETALFKIVTRVAQTMYPGDENALKGFSAWLNENSERLVQRSTL